MAAGLIRRASVSRHWGRVSVLRRIQRGRYWTAVILGYGLIALPEEVGREADDHQNEDGSERQKKVKRFLSVWGWGWTPGRRLRPTVGIVAQH